MLLKAKVHLLKVVIYSQYCWNILEKIEFSKDNGNEHDDMRSLQSAANRVYETYIGIRQRSGVNILSSLRRIQRLIAECSTNTSHSQTHSKTYTCKGNLFPVYGQDKLEVQ